MTNTLTGKARVGSMLRLDFYRLLHTPLFYIMLLIAAIIPAMVLTMAGMPTTSPDGVVTQGVEMTNVWQIIETLPGGVSGDISNFASFANINMVFIFAGILMAIFVAHDYSSGFVKSIFTVHAKKIDYVISKSAVGLFGGVSMILTYVLGAVLAGLFGGKAFDVSVGGLLMCLLSKMFLMGIFCGLFLAVAVFFKNRLWLTIIGTFLLGMMFYPAASAATLGSTVLTAIMSLSAGAVGLLAFGGLSALFLKRRDLA